MIAKTAGLALVTATLLASGAAMAVEGATPVSPGAIPPLDHVFVIMMENHAYGQIVNNPNAPFTNAYLAEANHATNYFAVAHPSLTNYLETVGGSNFGILSDNSPDWHNATCIPNIVRPATLPANQNRDDNGAGAICPIAGSGMDAPTTAQDFTNEGPPYPIDNIDGTRSYPSAPATGKTIADQLAARGKSWKTYQENLPLTGADRVNNSNGAFTDTFDFSTLKPAPLANQTGGNVVALYAVKHNPFVYFKSVQESANRRNSLANVVGFDGIDGLYGDLATGDVPDFAFIVPNQCNDQHGKSASQVGPFCQSDPTDDGTQNGLNPALIYMGDQAIRKIVTSIKHSPAWRTGHNAIVVVWDENDYSAAPNVNKVLIVVDTNYAKGGKVSNTYYNHFSLLKSVQAGLGLPCLNHSCDADTATMSDLFGRARDQD